MSKKKPRAGKPRPTPKQPNARRTRLYVALGVLVLIALVIYYAVLPRIVADRYQDGMATPVSELKKSFTELEKGTDLTTAAIETGPSQQQTSQIISRQIQRAQGRLDKLDQANGKLVPLPLVFGNRAYSEARTLKRDYRYLSDQSRDVLNEYQKLNEYLAARSAYSVVLQRHLGEFNSLTDLSLLVGQSARLRAAATEIEQAGAGIDKLGPPPDVLADNVDTSGSYQKAAAGFRLLAQGVAANSDAQISTAATQIEAATAQSEGGDDDRLVKAVEQSALIREVRSLSEKIETVGS